MTDINVTTKAKKRCCCGGSYLSWGIVYGAGIGTALGVALDDLGVWLSIGAGLGIIIGMMLDKKKSGKSGSC